MNALNWVSQLWSGKEKLWIPFILLFTPLALIPALPFIFLDFISVINGIPKKSVIICTLMAVYIIAFLFSCVSSWRCAHNAQHPIIGWIAKIIVGIYWAIPLTTCLIIASISYAPGSYSMMVLVWLAWLAYILGGGLSSLLDGQLRRIIAGSIVFSIGAVLIGYGVYEINSDTNKLFGGLSGDGSTVKYIFFIIAGVLISIAGLSMFLFKQEKASPQKIKSLAIKKCKYCAEEIKAEAIYCRFCNKDL